MHKDLDRVLCAGGSVKVIRTPDENEFDHLTPGDVEVTGAQNERLQRLDLAAYRAIVQGTLSHADDCDHAHGHRYDRSERGR